MHVCLEIYKRLKFLQHALKNSVKAEPTSIDKITTEKLFFFQLIDRRYEHNSSIITTNINFSQWDDIFGDPLIASAIVDILLHHATVIPIKGISY